MPTFTPDVTVSGFWPAPSALQGKGELAQAIYAGDPFPIQVEVKTESGAAKNLTGAQVFARARRTTGSGGDVSPAAFVVDAVQGRIGISFPTGLLTAGKWRLQARVTMDDETKIVADVRFTVKGSIVPVGAPVAEPLIYSGSLISALGPLTLGVPVDANLLGEFSGGLAPLSIEAPVLPAGLVDDGDGTASGTPTTAGPASIRVNVSDADGRSAFVTEPLTVAAHPALADMLPAISYATVGVEETLTLDGYASGGRTPYAFAASLGVLDADAWSWTPDEAGDVSITFTLTDVHGIQVERTVTVPVAAPLVYSGDATSLLEPLTVGDPVDVDFAPAFSGGRPPYTIEIEALPSGIVDDGDNTASGSPDTAGDFDLILEARDADGRTVQVNELVTVTLDVSAGTVSAEGDGTLATVVPPAGYALPASSQQAAMISAGFQDVTMAVGADGALTAVDDMKTAYAALIVGEPSVPAVLPITLVRASDGVSVTAYVLLEVAGVTAPVTSFNSSSWPTGTIPTGTTLTATIDGVPVDYAVTAPMTNTALPTDEHRLSAPEAAGAIGDVYAADLVTKTIRAYFEPGILWMEVGDQVFSQSLATLSNAAYPKAVVLVTADASQLIFALKDAAGTTLTGTRDLVDYTPVTVGKVSMFGSMERAPADPITAAGVGFRLTPRIQADGTVSVISADLGSGFAFFKTDAKTEADALTLLTALPVASNAPVYSGDLAAAAGSLTKGTPADIDVRGEFSGGRTPHTYAIPTLPAGLVDDGDGTASGAPTAGGSATLAATATDARGVPVTGSATVTVAAVAVQTLYNLDPLTLNSAAGTPVLTSFNIAEMVADEEWALSFWWYRKAGEAANKELLRIEVPGQTQHILIRGQRTRWRNSVYVENNTLADAPVAGQWNHIMVHIYCAGASGWYGVRQRVNGGASVQTFASLADLRFTPERFQIAADTSLTEIAFLTAPHSDAQPAAFWNGGAGAYIDDVDLVAVGLTLRDKIEHHRPFSTSPGSWAEMERPEFDAATGDQVYWWDVPTPMDAHAQTGTLAWPTPDPMPSVPLGATHPLAIADISDALGTVTEDQEVTLDLRTLVSGGVEPYASLAMSHGATAGDGYSWSWTPSGAGDASLTLNVEDAAAATASATDVIAVQAAQQGTVATQTLRVSDPIILDSADATTPVIPTFDLASMADGDANALAIPLHWYRRPGQSANTELMRLEVPGQSKHVIIRGQSARWRNSGYAEASTADEPVEGAWNLIMVQLQTAGTYSGVRISINGGAYSSNFTSSGDIRFTPTRLQITSELAEVGFLAAPYDANDPTANVAPFWNAGAPPYLDQADLTGTSITFLDHIKLYRAAGATEIVDWATTDHPEFAAGTDRSVFWWDVPTPQEAVTSGGSLAWMAPPELALPTAESYQEISAHTETLYPGVPFRLRALHVFRNATDLEYTGTTLTAEPDPDDNESILLTADAAQAPTEDFLRGTNLVGETTEKGFRYQVLDPPALELSAIPFPDITLEAGECGPADDLWRHVTGGARPYRFEQISGPSAYDLKWWGVGKPMGAMADLGEMTQVIRCTDARGQTKDLVRKATTISQWDRTSDKIVVPAGTTNLNDFLYANAASGRVIEIPDGMHLQWSSRNSNDPHPIIPAGQPKCIIRGASKTGSSLQTLQTENCHGYMIEHLTVRHHGNSGCIGYAGIRNTIRDIRFEGQKYFVNPDYTDHPDWTPSVPPPGDPIDPMATYIDKFGNTKNFWYVRDPAVNWRWADAGFVVNQGEDLVLQDIEFYGQRETFKLNGIKRATVHNIRATHCGVDFFKIQSSWAVVWHKVRAKTFDGNANAFGAEHRDFLQLDTSTKFGNGDEWPMGLTWIRQVEFIAEVPEYDAQGIFKDWADSSRVYPARGYIGGDETGEGAYPFWNFEDIGIFAGSSAHGFTIANISDFTLERAVVVRHPAWNQSRADLRFNDGNSGQIKDTLYWNFEGRNDGRWTPQGGQLIAATKQTNTFKLDGSGTSYDDIFPNFYRTDMAYESPVDAVEDGADPSEARLWMDQNSAWAQANPTIGPSFLKDGVW